MRATVVAHPNIALVKYWGKRDAERNLPAAGSLSLTLGPLATRTRLEWTGEVGPDRFRLNGSAAGERDAARLSRFLDRVRALRPGLGAAEVVSTNDFPTAAGLASSSSGFAALALAAVRAAELDLDPRRLSVLARYGSGSAARSVFGGFVRMHAGRAEDGDDAFAEPLDDLDWPELRCVIAVTAEGAKDTPSTEGMNRTQQTSPYFDAWVGTVEPAIDAAIHALRVRSFDDLAAVAEASALQMHASAMAAVPGVLYFVGATVEVVRAVRAWRSEGLPVFFTIDAGPHVKVFTLDRHVSGVRLALEAIPGVLRTLVAAPAEGARVVEPEGGP